MRIVGGTVTPIALAVLRLTRSSNFVGCSTGRSAGFAPLRILSMNAPARRYKVAPFRRRATTRAEGSSLRLKILRDSLGSLPNHLSRSSPGRCYRVCQLEFVSRDCEYALLVRPVPIRERTADDLNADHAIRLPYRAALRSQIPRSRFGRQAPAHDVQVRSCISQGFGCMPCKKRSGLSGPMGISSKLIICALPKGSFSSIS